MLCLQSKGQHDSSSHGQQLQRFDLLQWPKVRWEGWLHLSVPPRWDPGVSLWPGEGTRYHQVSLWGCHWESEGKGYLVKILSGWCKLLTSMYVIQEQGTNPTKCVEHHQLRAFQPQGRDHGEQEGPCPRGGTGERTHLEVSMNYVLVACRVSCANIFAHESGFVSIFLIVLINTGLVYCPVVSSCGPVSTCFRMCWSLLCSVMLFELDLQKIYFSLSATWTSHFLVFIVIQGTYYRTCFLMNTT